MKLYHFGIPCIVIGLFAMFAPYTTVSDKNLLIPIEGIPKNVRQVGKRGDDVMFNLSSSKYNFQYTNEAGASHYIYTKISELSDQNKNITVLYNPTDVRVMDLHIKYYIVTGIEHAGSTIRSYEEISEAWNSRIKAWRYIGFSLIFIGTVLLIKYRLSRKSNEQLPSSVIYKT